MFKWIDDNTYSCSASPCPADENPHCIEYEDWDPSRCRTCEDGYFFKSVGSPCVSCDEIYHGTCAECENVDGCNICNCGDRDYDGSCGIRFCDNSNECETGYDTDSIEPFSTTRGKTRKNDTSIRTTIEKISGSKNKTTELDTTESGSVGDPNDGSYAAKYCASKLVLVFCACLFVIYNYHWSSIW